MDGTSTIDAVNKSLAELQGTWGLAIMDTRAPEQIIVAKNGSPILIGIARDRMFIASESSAFARHTKEFIALQDGEVAVVRADAQTLDVSRVETAAHQEIQTSPAPYPHWTIKEIMEQPQSLSSALNYGGRISSDATVKLGGLDQNRARMLAIRHLVITACGSSFHAALYGAHLMRMLHAFDTVQVVDGAEFRRDVLPLSDAGVLAISQSGETKDVHRSLVMADELGVPTLSVVNTVRSLIARTTGCGVYLNAGRETAVASTKAFTNQVAVLALVAVWFAQEREKEHGGLQIKRRRALVESLHRLPINAGMCIGRIRQKCAEVAAKIAAKDHMFVLGKGLAHSIAMEGALKIKEITYIHAEGYAGGALKHGPFALIEPRIPILMVILQDEHEALMTTALHEVETRGAHTIVVTDMPGSTLGEDTIRVPSNGMLTPLLAVLPMQLLAYELALLRDLNPDKPRHLAKTITVD
eukprot:TRINITY_DN3609_c0_g1_i1.p1 TRINITY_DN3609_c0_g1~~TRINITY_DN3609_c0_g1_i1.p1  ORF type:complete len:470 (-),score=111.13 TRINITY_DN3609_c0_g1_i1:165-1574(-)